jgi:anti-sigma-K factor RskA
MTDTPDHDDDAVLAAEYALRLLEGDEERSARARLASEPAFAADVAFWNERLSEMAAEIEPVVPSRRARRELMTRLFGAPENAPFWRRIGIWQTATAISLATAVFLGLQVANQERIPTLYATELASADNSLRVLAVYDSVTGHIRLTRTDGGAAAGRDLELWGIAEGEAPVSIGVLPDDSVTAGFAVPAVLFGTLPSLTLAISDEPDGGSPTGQPTGDVLAVGAVSEL